MLQVIETLRFLNGGKNGRKRQRSNGRRVALPQLHKKLSVSNQKRRQRKQQQQQQKVSTERMINSLDVEVEDAKTDVAEMSFHSSSINTALCTSSSNSNHQFYHSSGYFSSSMDMMMDAGSSCCSSSLTLEQSCHLKAMNQDRTKTLIHFACEQEAVNQRLRGATLPNY